MKLGMLRSSDEVMSMGLGSLLSISENSSLTSSCSDVGGLLTVKLDSSDFKSSLITNLGLDSDLFF